MTNPRMHIMEFCQGKTIDRIYPQNDSFMIVFTNGESFGARLEQTGFNEVVMKYAISGRVTSINGQPVGGGES